MSFLKKYVNKGESAKMPQGRVLQCNVVTGNGTSANESDCCKQSRGMAQSNLTAVKRADAWRKVSYTRYAGACVISFIPCRSSKGVTCSRAGTYYCCALGTGGG